MRSPALAFLAVAGVLLLPSAARAAEVRVDRPCYADPMSRVDTVRLTGSGFRPNADFRVTLDGRPLAGGTSRTDAAGNLSGSFAAPSIRTVSRRARQHRFVLGVQEGDNAPTTTFTVSRLAATFRPKSGAIRSLRVRFSVYGFNLQGATTPPVYLHYVSPRGRLARTVRLGTAGGACGFDRSKQRRLFAFKPVRGRWILQFDARRRYTPGSSRSSFLYVRSPVRVG